MTPLPPAAQFALRRLGILLAAAIFTADQGIKWLVTGPIGLQQIHALHQASGNWDGLVPDIPLLPIFGLSWMQNYGISFGLLTAESETQRWFLVALTLLVAGAVALWLWRERARGDVIALGLVLGGAMGNIVDRVRVGYVVDFADLHFGDFRPFLIFNVADAAITIGVLLLVARALLVRDKAV